MSSGSSQCGEHHCITCGDDGVPMTVLAVDEQRALALCAEEGGTRHTVEITLVEPVSGGDQLLVHAGTAIAALAASPPQAAAQLGTTQRTPQLGAALAAAQLGAPAR